MLLFNNCYHLLTPENISRRLLLHDLNHLLTLISTCMLLLNDCNHLLTIDNIHSLLLNQCDHRSIIVWIRRLLLNDCNYCQHSLVVHSLAMVNTCRLYSVLFYECNHLLAMVTIRILLFNYCVHLLTIVSLRSATDAPLGAYNAEGCPVFVSQFPCMSNDSTPIQSSWLKCGFAHVWKLYYSRSSVIHNHDLK